MSTSLSGVLVNQRTSCAVCEGARVERVMAFPGLPLTGLFSSAPQAGPARTFDQSLLVCPDCGHGQLENQINPDVIYDQTYSFRTSMSATAKSGTDFFMGFMDRVAAGRRFRMALDLGCNDLHLLGRLKDRAESRVGIHPIWEGREDEGEDKSIRIFGSTVEKIDLKKALAAKPDLIVCRHTLEHIYDPSSVISQLAEAAADDALFVFEVPGFDALVRKYRFDHVFHQHLQYFNLSSFRSLLERKGLTFLSSAENYHDWGALIVAFTKGKGGSGGKNSRSAFSIAQLRERFSLFQQQMAVTRKMLDSMEAVYGYGAAQMLPVLAYHLKTDLSGLKAVLDDDPAKRGLYYKNLPLKIENSTIVSNWAETSIFLTAVDNSRPILTRLLASNRPKHILHPFHIV